MFEILKNWCDLPTPMGVFRLYDSGNEGVRIISYGDIYSLKNGALLRMHSSCLASEVFGANDCDCADQLREAMKLIAQERGGVIIHFDQEGRGQGLARKIRAVHLMQYNNFDTFDAFEHLSYDQDNRTYFPAVNLLKHLKISDVRLISNNPRKQNFLKANGIKVMGVSTHPNIRIESREYLAVKNEKLGHTLPLEEQSYGTIYFYHSDQPWGALSNFSKHSVFLKNKIWPTVEHYYQSQKFKGTECEELIRCASTPTLAKELARAIPKQSICSDWADIKQDVMLEGLRAKFLQHPELHELLISSGVRKLSEHTTNDLYWGDGGDGSGQNILGELLMRLRLELNNPALSNSIAFK